MKPNAMPVSYILQPRCISDVYRRGRRVHVEEVQVRLTMSPTSLYQIVQKLSGLKDNLSSYLSAKVPCQG